MCLPFGGDGNSTASPNVSSTASLPSDYVDDQLSRIGKTESNDTPSSLDVKPQATTSTRLGNTTSSDISKETNQELREDMFDRLEEFQVNNDYISMVPIG